MTLRQDQRRTDGPLSAVAGHGLGLLTGAIVEQHFDGRNGRLERFTDLLRDGPQLDKLSGRGGAGANMLGLAVEEGTALVARADRLEVVGDRAAHVFLKSPGDVTIVWHTLGSGGKAALKRNRRGEVTLTREAPRAGKPSGATVAAQLFPFVLTFGSGVSRPRPSPRRSSLRR
jgi:hypothetical protein